MGISVGRCDCIVDYFADDQLAELEGGQCESGGSA
jgi:hypothetical protein